MDLVSLMSGCKLLAKNFEVFRLLGLANMNVLSNINFQTSKLLKFEFVDFQIVMGFEFFRLSRYPLIRMNGSHTFL